MEKNKEIRMFTGELESRKDEERQKSVIEGTPIVFGVRTNLGWWDEVIDTGALDITAAAGPVAEQQREQHDAADRQR